MVGGPLAQFRGKTPSPTLPRRGGGNVMESVFFPSPKMGEGQGGGILPRCAVGDFSC